MPSYVLHIHTSLMFWQCGQSLTVTSKPRLFHQIPKSLGALSQYELAEQWGTTLGRTVKRSISVFFWLFFSAESTSEADRNQPPLDSFLCRGKGLYALFIAIHLFFRGHKWKRCLWKFKLTWTEGAMWAVKVEGDRATKSEILNKPDL